MNIQQNELESRHVVVIGGGITGLSAAWYLQRAGVRYSLLEQSGRWGGKVHTEYVNDFVIETGADAFLTRKPWALELARELGLDDRIIGVNRDHSRTFVLSGGQLVPIPDGVQLLAPTDIPAFMQSPLFSWRGKLRMLLDWFIPPRTDETDESMAAFVRRRVGAETVDKLAEPLLAGIYNAEIERLSIMATFPQYRKMEREHGSLIRGMMNAKAIRGNNKSSQPMFISFRRGTGEIIDALAAQLDGDLRLNCGVETIETLPGGGYRVHLENGDSISADSIILTTPANVAAKLLTEIAPDSAQQLNAIRYTSVGAVAVGYRKADVPHSLDGLGVVIPGSEGRNIDGITFATTKWRYRAPNEHVLLRVFFGGPNSRAMMTYDDEKVLSMVRDELCSMLGIEAQPVFHHVSRWHDAYPQYDVGHLDRVADIEAALPAGIHVAGSSYRGIGVPDCVHQGKQTAEKVVDTQSIHATELIIEPFRRRIYGNDSI
jgi:oxygen-dependent protoporphyrinogen oxidase